MLQPITGGAQPVTGVAAGRYHSLFLKRDGSLWAMGNNVSGALGDGTFNQTNRPEQIVTSNVMAITAGAYHSLYVRSDGSLWAMGWNYNGQLGDGSYHTFAPYGADIPEQIVATNVAAIAAGGLHSLFLKNDGSLWAMGDNASGQLGDGTYNPTNQPEMIAAGNITTVAAGSLHSLFLKGDGSLWAMGDNESGQLGDGTYNQTNQPEMIVASNVTTIAAGDFFSVFLKSDGSLWAMGANDFGQLGDGSYNTTNRPEMIVASNVVAIAAGSLHSLFLKSDGSLWGMGNNNVGQLGDGSANNDNGLGLTNRPEQIVVGDVTAVAAGGYHSLFLTRDGSLWAMGSDQYGQLGDGTYNSINLPKRIVVGHPGFQGYNQLAVQLLSGGNVSLSYIGITGTNYVLERTFNLSPADWIPQVTNAAGFDGLLIFTNTPDPTTNNFWRIRPAP
jgi:alpha-tubulin suppressor-like RCC1 family protein